MNEKQNQVCYNLLQTWAINSRIVSWTDELDQSNNSQVQVELDDSIIQMSN